MSVSGTSGEFDREYYESNSQDGDRPALRMYERVAARLAGPGGTAVDYGCGSGHFVRRLSRHFTTIAYDLSPYARLAAGHQSPTSRVIDDTAHLDDQSVDLVCSLHVLEHVPDPSTALDEIARILKPGAALLYVVPNPDGWGHRIKGSAWFAFRDSTHCSLLSQDEWLSRTARAGFDVVHVASDGLWDPPYVRWLPKPLQLATLGLGAAVSLLSGRALLPPTWGECLIVISRRRSTE